MVRPIGHDQWLIYSTPRNRKRFDEIRKPKPKPERQRQPTQTSLGFIKGGVLRPLDEHIRD